MKNLAIIDVIFLVLVLLLVLRCAIKGFVAEFFAMASVVLGVLAGFFFYRGGAAFIRTKIFSHVRVLPELLAFLAIFVIVFLALKILEKILNDIIQGIHLSSLDHFLGIVFGLVEGIALVALVLFVFLLLGEMRILDPSAVLGDSVFAEILLPLVRRNSPVFTLLPFASLCFYPGSPGAFFHV
jgi:membrane protein required for colicin V production